MDPPVVEHDVIYSHRQKMKLWNLKRIKYLICVITPFVLIPLAISEHKESRCGFVIIWMAVYWLLEPVDLTVTALLPVPLMPLLGILDANQVVGNYMKEVLMMYIGGLGVAIAVEYCNLHERVALKVLLTTGSDTKWLLFGFMFTTMFMSMWISNTATTAMMVPIIDAVMTELRHKSEDKDSDEGSKLNVLHMALLLSVAYSANCGGTGTITGTSPNMLFKGYMEEHFPTSKEITYVSWMAYNIPGMVLCVLAGWVILQVIYVPCWVKQGEEAKNRIKSVITRRYEELGRITFHEAAVFVLFLLLVFLWVFREPKFIPGWADALASDKYIGDAVPAIGVLILMFMLPAEPWKPHTSPPLLKWKIVQQKLPWGLVLLLGGGYALADGAQKSGLSNWLAQEMSHLFVLPQIAILSILCIVVAILTEVMSNSTVTNILLPVLSQMAVKFQVNPLYLMLPATVVTSYAFMLPVATGPNAIVFGVGLLKVTDMMKPGVFMNITACIIQLFMVQTLGAYMFDLNNFPDWAYSSALLNNTLTNGTDFSNNTINNETQTVYLS